MNKIFTKIRFYLYKIYYGYILNKRSSLKLDFNWKKIKVTRTDIINQIITQYKINSNNDTINYLEIGCFDNANFNNIKNDSIKKYGVDPVQGGNIRLTSDQFFKNNKIKFHCIFIDGLHQYEQVQKDIINSINFLHDDGYIIMHDCIPRNYIEEHVPRFPGNHSWTGDVWKACVELSTSPGIDFKIFLCDNGVGVFKVNRKKLKYNYLNNEIGKKIYEDYINLYFKKLNKIKIFEINKIISYL